jgi:hypothetical protein
VLGAAFLLLGVGIGYWMFRQPEGLNPDWNIWVAELAPATFAMGGIYLISDALGYPRFAVRFLQAIMVAFLIMLNWYAFAVAEPTCTQAISFLGYEILRQNPGPGACRFVLVIFTLTVDAIVVIPAAMYGWRRFRA